METTTDYKIFKVIQGNRDLYPNHIEKLRAAIKQKNLLPYIPLLLNEHMQVIDGQHRLEVAKLEELPVTYVIIPGLRLEDVMSLNVHSKSWTMIDFIDAWIKAGRPDYQVLKDIAARYTVATSVVGNLLMMGPSVALGGGRTNDAIHDGTFIVRHLEFTKLVLDQINDLVQYCDFNPKKNRILIKAIAKLDVIDDFDFATLLAKLKFSGLRIEQRSSLRYFVLEIEDIYNWRNSKHRVNLYSQL